MKTPSTPQKFFSQKGQGLVEYALLIGFVGALGIGVMLNGGFSATIDELFGSTSENLSSVSFTSTEEEEETSFDYETQTGQDNSASQNFKPLNWEMEVIPFADMTYNTIARNSSVDDALRSEVGFFNTLFSAVEGHLASTKSADGTKDWESFLTMIENTKTRNNIPSTYTRDEQKITVKRAGKDLRITYSDKEGTYYYKLSPDANNVMQIETNSKKTYSQFYSSVIRNADGGGWQYSK